jgi:hypothetical protein
VTRVPSVEKGAGKRPRRVGEESEKSPKRVRRVERRVEYKVMEARLDLLNFKNPRLKVVPDIGRDCRAYLDPGGHFT